MSKTSELLYSLPSRLETTIIGMLTSRYIDEAAVDRTYSSNISLINWAWKVSVVVYIGCRKSIKDSQLEDEISLINTGTYYLHSMTFKYQATLKKTGSSAGTGPIGRHTALFTYLLTYLPTYRPTTYKYLPTYLLTKLTTYMYLPTYLPTYLSTYLNNMHMCLPIYLLTDPSPYLAIYLPTYLPIYLPA